MAATVERAATTVSAATSRPDKSWQGTLVRTRCLEVQGNAYGIVLDVGFIGPLTRCRSGLTKMVATRGGYRRSARSVLVNYWRRAYVGRAGMLVIGGGGSLEGENRETDPAEFAEPVFFLRGNLDSDPDELAEPCASKGKLGTCCIIAVGTPISGTGILAIIFGRIGSRSVRKESDTPRRLSIDTNGGSQARLPDVIAIARYTGSQHAQTNASAAFIYPASWRRVANR